jgi:hypothetical protein
MFFLSRARFCEEKINCSRELSNGWQIRWGVGESNKITMSQATMRSRKRNMLKMKERYVEVSGSRELSAP